MIVANREYRSFKVARALSFIETFSIDRKTLYDLAARFPRTLRLLRLRAIIIALINKGKLERSAEGERSSANDVFSKMDKISTRRAEMEHKSYWGDSPDRRSA